MIIKEKYPRMKGVLKIVVTDKNGNVVIDEDHNLIVSTGLQSAAKAIGGDANFVASKVAVGEDNTPPDVSDAMPLLNQFVKSVSTTTYPETNSVQFDFIIESTEANGTSITEFGLVTANDTLIARRVVSTIQKTSDFNIQGYWKLTF